MSERFKHIPKDAIPVGTAEDPRSLAALARNRHHILEEGNPLPTQPENNADRSAAELAEGKKRVQRADAHLARIVRSGK